MSLKKSLVNSWIAVSMLFIFSLPAVCQGSGVRRSVTDSNTGMTFNTFRTDSAEAVFYVVLKQGEFLYDEPKSNAELKYSLNSEAFVEFVSESGTFYNVRILDKFHGIIEGWVRKSSLQLTPYYGRSFKDLKKLPPDRSADLRINPNWIKDDSALVYADSSLTGTVTAVLKKGDLVFLKSGSYGDGQAIYYNSNKNKIEPGFIAKDYLTELALIPDGRTDFDSLYSKFSPALLKNDLDRSGFASYNGILFSGTGSGEFTEDKVCREIGPDTLKYRYSTSLNMNEIKRKTEIKNAPAKKDIAMFRFLPDEDIATSRDTVKCSVIEFVSVPKSARIAVGKTEESSVTNSITKLYITKINKENMYIVFQRENAEYKWTYSRDLETKEILKSKTETEKTVKRLIAFRKH
jgi:hypothetical protein